MIQAAPEESDLGLKRSPIYWAKQSSTATLICGGTDDARVHPSQSIELFRRMKMNNHPAVAWCNTRRTARQR
jgi:dipeptidyl aminopeptidase/acylaminoacyl peptidase